MINGLDLFSGIGGISLALKPWVRTVAYCESDQYAQGVLLSRMRDGSLDPAPIWCDVRTLSAKQIDWPIDIITGGFPCQDLSVAGAGRGLDGERSGLFFEIVRLARELRPAFIFLENVPAVTVRGLDRILLEITALGYDCRWTVLSAGELGAPHLRKRWWLLAHAASERLEIGEGFRGDDEQKQPTAIGASWWEAQPAVGRVVDELPYRVDRIRCLGNSVVPLCAQEAFKRLSGLKGE